MIGSKLTLSFLIVFNIEWKRNDDTARAAPREAPREIFTEIWRWLVRHSERKAKERGAPELERRSLEAERKARRPQVIKVDGGAFLTAHTAVTEQNFYWFRVHADDDGYGDNGAPERERVRNSGSIIELGSASDGDARDGRVKRGWNTLKAAIKAKSSMRAKRA